MQWSIENDSGHFNRWENIWKALKWSYLPLSCRVRSPVTLKCSPHKHTEKLPVGSWTVAIWVCSIPASKRISSPLQNYPRLSERKKWFNVNYPTLTSVFQLDCTCVHFFAPLCQETGCFGVLFCTKSSPGNILFEALLLLGLLGFMNAAKHLKPFELLIPRAYGEWWESRQRVLHHLKSSAVGGIVATALSYQLLMRVTDIPWNSLKAAFKPTFKASCISTTVKTWAGETLTMHILHFSLTPQTSHHPHRLHRPPEVNFCRRCAVVATEARLKSGHTFRDGKENKKTWMICI